MCNTYHCPNCHSSSILARETVNRFYEVTSVQPESNYYETGAERELDYTVIEADFVCDDCCHVFDVEDVAIEEVEESEGTRTETFSSKEAAAAFCQGLECAGDHGFIVGGPYPAEEPGYYYVVITEAE